MSDRTTEINSSVKAAGAGISDAVSGAGQCLESARNKYETAFMHGWGGVAGNIELAVGSLEGAVGQLSNAEQASQTSSSVLDEITDKLSSLEVAAHLVTASGELNAAHNATEASISLIDEAISYCGAAGQESLPVALNSLRDVVVEILDRVLQCRNDVDAQLQDAGNFADLDVQLSEPASGGARGSFAPPPGMTTVAPSSIMVGRWADPQERETWVRERLADPVNSRPMTISEPWADYQRKVSGGREVRIGIGDDEIWADGLQVDPDTVVAAEAKYVNNPDRSMYEGRVPAAMEDRLLRQFDYEMDRYGKLVMDPDNPVGRIRIMASTKAAADYLGNRARRRLGPTVDLDVRHIEP